VFDTTYASTHASLLAQMLADAYVPANSVSFSAYKALMLASETDPQATTDATEYCRRCVIPDAIEAAYAAADAATNWITVTRYGVGADPVLDGVDQSSTLFGIEMGGVGEATTTGGIKIEHIEGKRFRLSPVHKESVTGFGIWISGCNLHDNRNIPGGIVAEYNFNHAGRSVAFGLIVTNTAYTLYDNCTCDTNDAPWINGGGNFALVRDTTCDQSYYSQCFLNFATTLVMLRGSINRMTNLGPGFADGSAGLLTQFSTDTIVRGVSITNTVKRGNDGEAVDMEGAVTNALFQGCTWTGNACSALLDLTTSLGANAGTMIDDCTIGNNGGGYLPAGGIPALARDVHADSSTAPTTNRTIYTRNSVTKSPQNFLFAAQINTGLTDVLQQPTGWWPATSIFGPDNSVT
jgi:hypothetical protein